MCGLATPAHDSDGGHKVVSPLLDDVEWDRVGCSIPYDTSCHSLYIAHFFLAGRDVVFAIRSGWGNRGNGFADRP